MYICHPTKSPLYTFVSSYRTYTLFTWKENEGSVWEEAGSEQASSAESESPIRRPITRQSSTPVVPPATTTSSGLPTGVGGAVLGAAQILSTPAVLVPGAPWAPDPFGTLQLIREVDSKIDPFRYINSQSKRKRTAVELTIVLSHNLV